jgi:hypothetical protein
MSDNARLVSRENMSDNVITQDNTNNINKLVYVSLSCKKYYVNIMGEAMAKSKGKGGKGKGSKRACK